MAQGYCSLEIISTSSSGNYISSGAYEGYCDMVKPMTIDISYAHEKDLIYSEYATVVRGPSDTLIPLASRITDPKIAVESNDDGFSDYNNNWRSNNRYLNISGAYPALSDADAGIFYSITGSHSYTYDISPGAKSTNSGYAKFETSLYSTGNIPISNYVAELASWASYDLGSSGTSAHSGDSTNYGVVSWAIELANDLYVSGAELYTGAAPLLDSYIYTSGTDIRETYIQYCLDSNAVECATKEVNDKAICYTGVITGATYSGYLSSVKSQFKNSLLTPYDGSSSMEYIDNQSIEQIFGYWSGRLEYNDFYSGDRVYFELYPFDYTGVYSKIFYKAPPINSTGFYLQYPEDFSNIDQLVDGLNTRLNSGTNGLINYPVWYNYPCIFGSGNVGIYITGSLLSAEKKNEHLIEFQSLRNVKSGYDIYLELVQRPVTIPNANKLKYLLPTYVELQGSYDDATWYPIDTKTNVDWTGLEPTTIIKTGLFNESGVSVFPLYETGIDPFIDILDVSESGQYITLDSFIQSGYYSKSDKCSPEFFSRQIDIVYPSGFPATVKPCSALTGESGESGQKDTDTSVVNPNAPVFSYDILRTGWNIDSGSNKTLAYFPYYDYSHYRVYLSGFNSFNTGNCPVSNKFIVNNINLFYGTSGVIANHTGADQCVIGANYTLDVQGVIPVIITGDASGLITLSDSGVKVFDNVKISAPISGLSSGDYIKFNKRSGKLVVDRGTGFITDSITGSGTFSTGISDWFYNTGNSEVTFYKEFEQSINGTGRFSGHYTRLKPQFVNQQLAMGGFLNQTFSVNITTGISFTGLLLADLPENNLTGYYKVTGHINEQSTSGYYQLITGASFDAGGLGLLIDYVDGGATGYKNSVGYLNYGVPQAFDYISINGKTVSFNSDTSNYQTPDYFATSGDLIATINSNPLDFAVTSRVENGKIRIDSLLSGELGNDIELSYGRGDNTGELYPTFDSSSLTGGLNYYSKITATGIFTGNLSQVFLSTGYYTVNDATGNLTGTIDSYQGVRDFSGIWNISTGNFHTGYSNFLVDGKLVSPSSYNSIVGGSDSFKSPSTIDFILLYSDLFSANNNSDIAKITISGVGTNSGISYYINGVSQ